MTLKLLVPALKSRIVYDNSLQHTKQKSDKIYFGTKNHSTNLAIADFIVEICFCGCDGKRKQ